MTMKRGRLAPLSRSARSSADRKVQSLPICVLSFKSVIAGGDDADSQMILRAIAATRVPAQSLTAIETRSIYKTSLCSCDASDRGLHEKTHDWIFCWL